MVQIVEKTFHLVGAYAGMSLALGQFHFIDGAFSFRAPTDEMDNVERFMALNWQAYPEGPLRDARRVEVAEAIAAEAVYAEPDEDLLTLDEPTVEVVIEPVVVAEADETLESVADALGALDQANDAHWTSLGLPSVDAVSALLGRTVSRKEIDASAPGFKRQ